VTTPIEAKGANRRIEFDGQMITITERFIERHKTKTISISSVTAVQWKPATLMGPGFIQFTISGGKELQSKITKQVQEAMNDENSVVFRRSQAAAFEQLRDAVHEAISKRAAGRSGSTPQPVGVAAELSQLAQLRDSGVLSDEEFQAQKAKLLNS
jgi:Short C-terminal domain/Domain of unknown function (DUF4429)